METPKSSSDHLSQFPDELLYLYSSNLRPLYAQDILDIIALPQGARFQFRYLKSWIEPQKTLSQWEQLVGKKVLVNFSLQQAANYHDPAFIPIRLGRVIETEVIGSIYRIEFEISDYIALRKSISEGKARKVYGPSVSKYKEELTRLQVPSPYEYWAGLGPGPWNCIERANSPSDQMILFERTTEFLSHTESFRQARFFRTLSLREAGGQSTETKAQEGRFSIAYGHSYELILAHTQPADIETREEFLITADEGLLRIIGKKSFEVSSRYDLIKIPLHAVQSPNNERRDTILAIDPAPGVQGPRLRLHIQVRPDTKRTAVGIAGSAAGVVLLGIPSLVPNMSLGWKLLFILSAASLIGFLSSFGLKRS